MTPTDFRNRPTLPFSKDIAIELGIRVANDFTIKTLIRLLNDQNGKRKFQ